MLQQPLFAKLSNLLQLAAHHLDNAILVLLKSYGHP